MTTTRKSVGPIALAMIMAIMLIVSAQPLEARMRAMTWQEAFLGPIGAALYLVDVACACVP